MKKVKMSLNYTDLDYSGLVVFGTGIHTAMDANPSFPDAVNLVAKLPPAISDLDTAVKSAHPVSADLKAKRMQLEKILYALKAQVELECNNDEVKALSSGFALQSAAIRKPKGFVVKQGMGTGTAELSFTSVQKRAGYVWEFIQDPIHTNQWQVYDYTVIASLHVTGLTPGSKYWFRVKMVTSEGHQPYSDPHMLHVI